jgi:tetratricopeptide (TPR) repeat protein
LNPGDSICYLNRGTIINHLLIGNALSDLGLREEAIKDYSMAIKLDATKVTAYYNRGTSRLNQ